MSDWTQLLAEVRELEAPATLRGRVFSHEMPPVVQPRTRGARRAGAWAIAAVGTLLVVGLLILAAHSRSSTSQIEPAQPAPHDSTIAFLRYQGHTDVAASNTLMISRAGKTRILLQRPTLRFVEVALSPNGRYVAVVALPAIDGGGRLVSHSVRIPTTVQVIATHGIPRPTIVASGVNAGQLAWSTDSKALAFIASLPGRQAVVDVVRPPGDSKPGVLTHGPGPPPPIQITRQVGKGYDAGPSWSPDGRTIGFTRITETWHAMLVDVATKNTRPLPAGEAHGVVGPLWQPHGHLIAAYAHQTFLTTATSTGLTAVPHSFRNGSVPLGWSSDGRYLLLRANPQASNTVSGPIDEPCARLFTYDVQRSSTVQVGCGYGAIWEPRVDRIAYLAPSGAGSESSQGIYARRLFTVSALGTDRHLITRLAAGDSFPVRGP